MDNVVGYNMNEKEEILRENMEEYTQSANKAYKEEKYNTAVTLFFKAIAAASDLYILKKEGRAPSSHQQRFRIAQEKHPKIYNILDKDFSFYQDSYSKRMNKEAAEVLKEDAQEITKAIKQL